MGTTTRSLCILLGMVLGAAGCSPSPGASQNPLAAGEEGTRVVSTLPAPTPVSAGTSPMPGIPVTFEGISLVIPTGIARGADTGRVDAVEQNSEAPWEITSSHVRFRLVGYLLQGRFHEAAIFFFPADEYARSSSRAAEQIDRLRKVLGGTALLEETLPQVAFFNASPLLTARIQRLSFQNGTGVRTLTQYAQYAAPVNNHELFYHFQGLTSDGQTYIVAILPVSAGILPANESPEASIPEGGIALPQADGPNRAYYFSVMQKLNSLAPESYTPSLRMLDDLIRSILVT